MKRYAKYEERLKKLAEQGYLKSEIARKMKIDRDTVAAIAKFYGVNIRRY